MYFDYREIAMASKKALVLVEDPERRRVFEEFLDSTAPLVEVATREALQSLIEERNRGRVIATRPKDLPIESVIRLIDSHLKSKYPANAPRLPQLAIYAAYECLVPHAPRYRGCALDPLGRMKAADRKAGTFGDIVVSKDGIAFEAVEIKYGCKGESLCKPM